MWTLRKYLIRVIPNVSVTHQTELANLAVEIQSTHLQAKLIKRSKRKSAVAAAAYRSGQKLIDERAEKTFDYTRRQQVDAVRILTPYDAPDWAHDRARLWNEVEAVERRKDAQLAREIVLSLPHSLSAETRAELVWNFAADNFVAHGMIADIALHGPGIGDPRNFHAHIMLTMRDISPDGFGKKNRDWNANAMLEGWKIAWEAACNTALENADINIRVDRRSIADRHQSKLDAAGAATDPTEKHQLEIEAERLDYIPRPHLPPRVYRAMAGEKPIPPRWQEPINDWKVAKKSRADAQLRADKLQTAHEAEVAAKADEDAQQQSLADQRATEARQTAQEATEHHKEVQQREIEDLILQSRTRVLRGRAARNTAQGIWQNLRTGKDMFRPFNASALKAATDRFFTAARSLLKIWNDFRDGRNQGDFRNTEDEYIEAGADLAKMHLVLEAPQKLTGSELLAEQDRLSLLEGFEDQPLIVTAINRTTGRLTKITEYIGTPEGSEKIKPALAEIQRKKAKQAEQDHRKAQKAEAARQERRAQEIEEKKAAARAREADIAERTKIIERALAERPVRKILQSHGITLDQPVGVIARDEKWDQFRRGEKRVTWYAIQQDIEALEAKRIPETRPLPEDKPQAQSAPEPKSEKPTPQSKKQHKPDNPGDDFSP